MTNSIKSRVKKIILIFIIAFVALFVFRLAYGYQKTKNILNNDTSFFSEIVDSRNYASKKYKRKGGENNGGSVKVDQKYEKIASIQTKSSEFNAEEKRSRNAIEEYKGIIQFEQKSGNAGARKLNLVIGVPPANFDSLYQDLIKIGKVGAKQITKKDKTNEYKELNARKKSLEKIRASLIELKSKGGKIEEYMDLENRILDIEQKLQNLGVNLGDFDEENEFCTVQFSLNEGREVSISFMHRVKVALEWTLKRYFFFILISFLVLACSYILVFLIDRLKIIQRLINNK